ncbi:hypothetical protein CWI38_1847p0020 [Hamiltosporidium tvaerminnensis]|uniref:Uncharacterized protein n=1 Tax=Hamiltosporidium tvaerminnensis TaxID=1176355 RepID=A0A4Q9LPH1_9MICR|nr:hypothetical protein CWI38_1847p0020 [Hamiltosporidium tvaerminnensis]
MNGDSNFFNEYNKNVVLSHNTKKNDHSDMTFDSSRTKEDINREFDDIKLKICGECCDIYQNLRIYNKYFGEEKCIACNKTERVCLNHLLVFHSPKTELLFKNEAAKSSKKESKASDDMPFVYNITCRPDSEMYLYISYFLNKSQKLKDLLKKNPNMPITFEELKLLNPSLLNALIEIIRIIQIENLDFVIYEKELTFKHMTVNKTLNNNLLSTELYVNIIVSSFEEFDLNKFREILNEISYFIYKIQSDWMDWGKEERLIRKEIENFLNHINSNIETDFFLKIRTFIHSIYYDIFLSNRKPERLIEKYVLLSSLMACESIYIRNHHNYDSLTNQDCQLDIKNNKLDLAKKLNEIMFRIISCVTYDTSYYISFNLLAYILNDLTDIIHKEQNEELRNACEIIKDFHLMFFFLPRIFIEKFTNLTGIIIYMIIIAHRENTFKFGFKDYFNDNFCSLSLKDCYDLVIAGYISFLTNCKLLVHIKRTDSDNIKFKYKIALKILNEKIEKENIIMLNNTKYIKIYKDTSREVFRSIKEYINSNFQCIRSINIGM